MEVYRRKEKQKQKNQMGEVYVPRNNFIFKWNFQKWKEKKILIMRYVYIEHGLGLFKISFYAPLKQVKKIYYSNKLEEKISEFYPEVCWFQVDDVEWDEQTHLCLWVIFVLFIYFGLK